MSNQPCAIALPDGSCYDPDQAQDHTGQLFLSRGKPGRRDPRRDPRNFMRDPAWLQCPECRSTENFAILAESHPMGDGMMQIYCSRGHAVWPVLQMNQPQMSNAIAKQLGLPQAEPAGIDITVDLDDE
jgi:hypothetical protein